MRWMALTLALLAGCRPAASGPAAVSVPHPVETSQGAAAIPPPEFDIRAEDGTILVPAADIVDYEWTTHTMRWRPEALKRVFGDFEEMPANGRFSFAICVGGKPVYHARSMFSGYSYTLDTVALVNPVWDEIGPRDILESVRIQLGYPTPEFFAGADDPRPDPAVRAALQAAGKWKTRQPGEPE